MLLVLDLALGLALVQVLVLVPFRMPSSPNEESSIQGELLRHLQPSSS